MGIKQIFINPTKDTREVALILANGAKDSMNLQPGGRASPPPGSKIDPQMELSYRSWLVVHSVADANPSQAEDDE